MAISTEEHNLCVKEGSVVAQVVAKSWNWYIHAAIQVVLMKQTQF